MLKTKTNSAWFFIVPWTYFYYVLIWKTGSKKQAINNKTNSSEMVILVVPQKIYRGTTSLWFIHKWSDSIRVHYSFEVLHKPEQHSFNKNDREETKRILAKDSEAVTDRFYEKFMILNTVKCYYTCIGKDTGKNETFKILSQHKWWTAKKF